MVWSQRMNLALDYIERHLDKALSLDEVARQACCSKYHFHRMFFASFNVTCAEYIRRRKLTKAATVLMTTDLGIYDIALQSGYDSPNAFTRAFRSLHGINPSQARLGEQQLTSYHPVFFPMDIQGDPNMHYKLVTIPAFTILGRSKKFEFDQFIKEGPKFWKQYVGSADYQALYRLNQGRPSVNTNSAMLSAYFPMDNSRRDEFVDVLGIEVEEGMDTGDFELHSVPAATYAEFSCTYKTAMKTNRYIYGQWFAATGYERDGSKPDIVAYFPIPFRPMSEMGLRWWIPIRGKVL